jgi:hypothetical protein
MFKSTYGRIKNGQLSHRRLYVPKAIDFTNDIEVFKIGAPSGDEVPFSGDIYCLKIKSTHVPFVIYSETVISRIKTAEFNTSPYPHETPGYIPETIVQISHFGSDLKSFRCGRGTLNYQDCWPNSECHGYEFDSKGEKSAAFAFIQEALPILFFDNYDTYWNPTPTLCRKVQPAPHGTQIEIDSSGEIENSSLKIILYQHQKESLDEFINRLEVQNNSSPLTMEEFMQELYNAERRSLFYRVFQVDAFVQNERFVELLRSSYQAYYSDHFISFERFLIFVVRLCDYRSNGRLIFYKSQNM